MKKYLSLMKYEWKTIIRDPLQIFLMLFPFLMLLLTVYLFPSILSGMSDVTSDAYRVVMLLLLIILLAMDTFMVGALGSFLLLEHKDEKTMNTIGVTPIGTSGYLMFKAVYLYIIAALSMAIVLFGTKWFAADEFIIGGVSLFENLSTWHILAFCLVSGLFSPALSLFEASLARNKVEGFALVKGMAILALVPMLMLLSTFSGGLQYALGIFPNFWGIKAMILQLYPMGSANLSFALYMVIGAAYNLLIMMASYKLFLKRVQF